MASLIGDMLVKEMRKSAPPVSLTGKTSNAEQTFGEMLDTKRADELSKTGSLGVGKLFRSGEAQERAAGLVDREDVQCRADLRRDAGHQARRRALQDRLAGDREDP